MLLGDSGYEVVPPNFYDREKYNATKIRKMIANGEEWEQFVPKKVAEIVKKVNGEKRIKVISKTETKPTEY